MAISNPVYLLDFYVYKPPDELVINMVDVDVSWNEVRKHEGSVFDKEASAEDKAKADAEAQDIIDFMYRVWQKAGLSDNATYLPKSVHPKYCGNNPRTDLDAAGEECRMAVCGAVEGLFKKTGLRPRDIDILVTTCSIYCPTPSMASMVVNAFGLRKDIQSYHLGGMGCANGVVGVNLVADLLKAHPNSTAIFVTNETTTPAFYKGRDKHRLVTNVLFRMGASASLLTNKPSLARKAKYVLQHRVRTHMAASNEAYKCIWYGPDSEGLNGIYLGLDVVKEASKGLTLAMMTVGRYVLNWGQIAMFAWTEMQRRMLGRKDVAPYSPCFADCIQHFLIHAGGAKVLDGIGLNLKLSESHLWPSRAVLRYFGNVSSSTTWYTLAAVESLRGVRKGDKVLQIGVGSGVKCGVNVWKSLRDIEDVHDAWRMRAEAGDRTRLPNVRHGVMHVGLRLLSLAILALLLALVVRLMTAGGGTQLRAGGMGEALGSLSSGLRSVTQRIMGAPVAAGADS